MRKVNEDEDLVLVFQNISAAFGCSFNWQQRFLLKLH